MCNGASALNVLFLPHFNWNINIYCVWVYFIDVTFQKMAGTFQETTLNIFQSYSEHSYLLKDVIVSIHFILNYKMYSISIKDLVKVSLTRVLFYLCFDFICFTFTFPCNYGWDLLGQLGLWLLIICPTPQLWYNIRICHHSFKLNQIDSQKPQGELNSRISSERKPPPLLPSLQVLRLLTRDSWMLLGCYTLCYCLHYNPSEWLKCLKMKVIRVS